MKQNYATLIVLLVVLVVFFGILGGFFADNLWARILLIPLLLLFIFWMMRKIIGFFENFSSNK